MSELIISTQNYRQLSNTIFLRILLLFS